jgi:hypothetical protein
MAQASHLVTQLPDVLPDLPDSSVLVFEGVPTGGFAGADAVRVLYDRDAVTVYSSDEVHCSDGRLVATKAGTIEEQVVTEPVFWLGAERNTLVHMADKEPVCAGAHLLASPATAQ